ncbi:hypothetical protein ACP70R_004380 [Stipagrostis hirtigluma subsp. patula]
MRLPLIFPVSRLATAPVANPADEEEESPEGDNAGVGSYSGAGENGNRRVVYFAAEEEGTRPVGDEETRAST